MKLWQNGKMVMERGTDIVITVLAITLFVSVIWITRTPENRLAMLLLVVSGGGLNLVNGKRLYQKPKQRNMGMSMMLVGAVILIFGFYLLNFR